MTGHRIPSGSDTARFAERTYTDRGGTGLHPGSLSSGRCRGRRPLRKHPESGRLRRHDRRAPDLCAQRPLAASAMSRTISASTRKRGPRVNNTFAGSRSSNLGRHRRSLAIRAGGDDEALHGLLIPPLRHEFRRQPIEQFGMGRRRPFVPKSSLVSTMPRPKNTSQI